MQEILFASESILKKKSWFCNVIHLLPWNPLITMESTYYHGIILMSI